MRFKESFKNVETSAVRMDSGNELLLWPLSLSVSETVSGAVAEIDTTTSPAATARCSHSRSRALHRWTARQSYWSPTAAAQSWHAVTAAGKTTRVAAGVTAEKLWSTHELGLSWPPRHVAFSTPDSAAEKSCWSQKVRSRSATNAAQVTRDYCLPTWLDSLISNSDCMLSLSTICTVMLWL